MVLQSIVFPNDYCTTKELFYNCDKAVPQSNEGITIPKGTRISFYSYMNNFDGEVWKRYAVFLKVYLSLEIQGKGTVIVKSICNNRTTVVERLQFDNSIFDSMQIDIKYGQYAGQFFFEVETDSEVNIRNAFFGTDEMPPNNVKIALNICTYHRREFVQKNLEQLKKSDFFESGNALKDKLSITIVDNGSELECIDQENIRLVHNPNTGGSGGFSRGLEEICANDSSATHVVFMDDDVNFDTESLYRLYALLAYMNSEFRNSPVAGRMFRMDKPWIQYTAAEVWNGGDLKHIGWNADMTIPSNINDMNDNCSAEYGGWWFCCFPMSFASVNEPLPFFIHCDDVEYGLRYGEAPIILNGIQVWHETYEYRQSPVIAYYDTRNSLIVNSMYGLAPKEEMLGRWREHVGMAYAENDHTKERMIILGMLDFLKGKEYILKLDAEKNHNKLCRIKVRSKFVNRLLWRYAKMKYVKVKDRI